MQRQAAVALHVCMKSAIVAGGRKRRSAMRVITPSELANKTKFELSALHERVKREMEGLDPNSYEFEILAHSLDNIRRAFAAPKIKPPEM